MQTSISTKNDTIALSGGFDPIHIGHVRMIQGAADFGDVVVILNTDEWLMQKKGYVFMPWEERAEIISEFASVAIVTHFDDSDDTACAAIRKFRPAAFANGGDRKKDEPESTTRRTHRSRAHREFGRGNGGGPELAARGGADLSGGPVPAPRSPSGHPD